MLIIIEVDRPIQLRPFWFRSRVMFRMGWLYFAIAISKLDLRQLGSGKYGWNSKSGYQPYAESQKSTYNTTKVATVKA